MRCHRGRDETAFHWLCISRERDADGAEHGLRLEEMVSEFREGTSKFAMVVLIDNDIDKIMHV